MMRRWLIRVPCLLALAFVVGVWIVSYFGGISFYEFVRVRWWGVMVVQGLGAIDMSETGHYYTTTEGEGIGAPRFNPRFFRGMKAKDWYGTWRTTLGFRYGAYLLNPRGASDIVFPLWLPTGLLMGLNCLVWRKTRPKYNGRGFPVEVVGKEATKP